MKVKAFFVFYFILFYICFIASPDDQVNRIKANQLILVLLIAAPNISALLLLLLYDSFLSNWAFLNDSDWMRKLVPKTLPRYDNEIFQ